MRSQRKSYDKTKTAGSAALLLFRGVCPNPSIPQLRVRRRCKQLQTRRDAAKQSFSFQLSVRRAIQRARTFVIVAMSGRGGGGRSPGARGRGARGGRAGRGGRGRGGGDDSPGLGSAVESEVEVDVQQPRSYCQVLTGECLLEGRFCCNLRWDVVRDASPCFPCLAS